LPPSAAGDLTYEVDGHVYAVDADVGAHVIGIVAAVLALLGLSAGSDSVLTSTEFVSGALLVLLLVSFFALWRARPRRPMRRAGHRMAAKLY